MIHPIKEITAGSVAARSKLIIPGDCLVRINGQPVADVLDYKYLSYDRVLLVELRAQSGGVKLVRLIKREGEDPGLVFERFLMDTERSCANKCVFCFVDQLPKGMRDTLYYKDDDLRLGFLQGNYVTLTNLTEREICRVIEQRISPLNVSVQSMNPGVRSFLLGNKRGGDGVSTIKRLAGAGITLHCQIVVCPGINDGDDLTNSMAELKTLRPAVSSVSVVPVGLTRHRENLPALLPFDRALAELTVRQVESFAAHCKEDLETRLFYCADELYIKAGLPLPGDEYYEDYPQLENGVGLMRLLITEFEETATARGDVGSTAPFSVATGTAAAPFIKKLIGDRGTVYAIQNIFFGDSVDVAGLVTGGDIISQLRGRDLGQKLLVPRNMLRHGDDVFLDDVTLMELSRELNIPVRVVEQDGADLYSAIKEMEVRS